MLLCLAPRTRCLLPHCNAPCQLCPAVPCACACRASLTLCLQGPRGACSTSSTPVRPPPAYTTRPLAAGPALVSAHPGYPGACLHCCIAWMCPTCTCR